MSPLVKRVGWVLTVGGPIGLVLMLGYAYALFGRSIVEMLADWRAVVAALVSIQFLILGHWYQGYRAIGPVLRFQAVAQPSEDQAARTVEQCLRIPGLIAWPSAFTYPLATVLALICIRIFGFIVPPFHWFAIVSAGGLLGVLVTLLQVHIFRRFINAEIEAILVRFPNLILDRLAAGARSINVGLFSAFTSILLVPTFLLLLLAISRTQSLYAREIALQLNSELGNIVRIIEEQGLLGGETYLEDSLKQVRWDRRIRLELRDKDDAVIFHNGIDMEVHPGVLPILREADRAAELRAAIRCPVNLDWLEEQENFNALSYDCGGSRHQVVAFRHLSGRRLLTAAADLREVTPFINDLILALGVVMLLMLVVSLFIALFISLNITRPIGQLSRTLDAISQGDLSISVGYYSGNELGWLAQTMARMKQGLSRMLGNLQEMLGSLGDSKTAVEEAGGRLLGLAEQQAQLLGESSAAVQEMNATIQNIASGVTHLDENSTDSSASLQELSHTTQLVSQVAQDLSELSGSINRAIGEMAESTKTIDGNIARLFDLTEQTSSAMIEIDSSLIEVRDNVQETENVSKNLLSDADEGMRAVRVTREGIRRIQEVSEETRQTIEHLKENARKIGRIVNVIDEIVDQTNLLSLNAAIIAAQAGEHGKGFAVVASEIKDLAQRTSQSTGEIAALIKDVQDRTFRVAEKVVASNEIVEENVRLSGLSERALEKILDGVRKTSEWMRIIALATAEQTRGSREVAKSVETIVVMTDEIANATKVQDAKNEDIHKEAQRMQVIAQQVRTATQEQTRTTQLIATNVEKVAELARTISQAMDEQGQGTRRVLEAEITMERRAKEQLAISQDLKRVVEELAGRSRQLEEELRRFKL